MKKFLVLMLGMCLFAGSARADLRGMFLRIECNEDFGLIDVSYHNINGDKIGKYFEQGKPFYRYEAASKEHEDSQTEVVLVNAYDNDELPFHYRCQLNKGQVYDIDVNMIPYETCLPKDGVTFGLTVNETLESQNGKKLVGRKILDNVALACGTVVQGFRLNADDTGKLQLVMFDSYCGSEIGFFGAEDEFKTINDEILRENFAPGCVLEKEDPSNYGIWDYETLMRKSEELKDESSAI